MICCVGLTCVDIVSFMPAYPEEDSDQRCAEQTWARGGNASNSATILASIGADVEFLGTIADDALLGFQQKDMNYFGIKHGNCPVLKCGNGPLSVVVCSKETGSRTIVHCKGNLPELKLEDFTKLNLNAYSWIHFEGRNEHTLPHLMKHVKRYNDVNLKSIKGPLDFPKYKKAVLPVSLETAVNTALLLADASHQTLQIELPIDNLEIMLPLADVVIVGKDYAKLQGAKNSTEAAQVVLGKVEPGTVVVCPWGEEGASFCTMVSNLDDVQIHKQSPYVVHETVDSLGAGDTFNATVIYCLKRGLEISTAVDYACKVASKKLEMRGMKGMSSILRELLPAP